MTGPVVLAHDEDGDPAGVPVVFLHAWGCERGMWAPQFQALARAGYHVFNCDFPGHGSSPDPRGANGDGDDAAAVIGLLEHAAPGGAVLVGVSFGARVAQAVAERRPDLVRALALFSPGTFGKPPTERLLRFAGEERDLLAAGRIEDAVRLNVETFVGPEARQAGRADVAGQVRRSLTRWLRAGTSTSARPVAADPARIRHPALVAVGALDLDHFRDVDPARQVPGARHMRLDWAGHLPNVERPDEVSGLLLRFLAEAL